MADFERPTELIDDIPYCEVGMHGPKDPHRGNQNLASYLLTIDPPAPVNDRYFDDVQSRHNIRLRILLRGSDNTVQQLHALLPAADHDKLDAAAERVRQDVEVMVNPIYHHDKFLEILLLNQMNLP